MTTLLVLAHPGDPELGALDSLPPGVRMIVSDRKPELFEAAADADIILAWWAPQRVIEAVVSRAPKLKWLHSSSAGVESILFPALVESDIVVTNARGAFSAALAEFVLGSMLFFAKEMRRMIRQQSQATWEPFDVHMLQGATLGIVGYGDIGRSVARLAHPFGMRILALRRRPEMSENDTLIDRVFSFESLAAMLLECDYVAAAAPLTPSTRGLLGEHAFAAMKPGAVVINVGRGAVVDEAALIRALQTNRIRGAALDVFETEPLPAEHPFWTMDNVLISPHSADHTAGWRAASMRIFVDNLARYVAGRPLVNVVDKRAGY